MRKLLIGTVVAVALVSIIALNQRARWTDISMSPTSGTAEKSVDRKTLYWRAPDGTPSYMATPARTKDGRHYLPVYEDQEPDFVLAKPKAPTAGTAGRKLLYYRNPMGLPDTSKVPKKDWMGMDYIPVYEGEEESGSAVKVSLDKVQRSGVRTAPVELRRVARPVRAPGIAKPDERTLYSLALRSEGFIEKLYVNQTGQLVKAGEPLFRLYSPQVVKVLVDYRIAMTVPGRGPRDEDGALQRLRNLAVPEAVIQRLRANPSVATSIDWPSPVSGVVLKKPVMEGMMMKAGDEVFRFADLANIWVIADVAEQDIGQVKVGGTAKIKFRAFPGEPFDGRVTFILHELEMATRTAKVRIEVRNLDYRIKHEMFADVEIGVGSGQADRLAVPSSALIDSGNRQVVLIDKGEGRFEPRAVKIGARGDDYVEIMEGVKAGELVVTTATFLIDAESNLKTALQAFTADASTKAEAKSMPEGAR